MCNDKLAMCWNCYLDHEEGDAKARLVFQVKSWQGIRIGNSMHYGSIGFNNTSLRTISEVCLNKFWIRYSSFVSRQWSKTKLMSLIS